MADISKITIPVGTTYNIKDATLRNNIDNIKAGGRNYLINSDYMPVNSASEKGFRASGNCVVSHITVTDFTHLGITGGIRVTNNGTAVARIGLAQDGLKDVFTAGEKYSQSCYIRATINSTGHLEPIWISSSQTTGVATISITTSWTKVEVHGLTLGGAATNSYSAGYVYVANIPAGGYFEVCGDMVEKEDYDTGWRPALEDAATVVNSQLKFSL